LRPEKREYYQFNKKGIMKELKRVPEGVKDHPLHESIGKALKSVYGGYAKLDTACLGASSSEGERCRLPLFLLEKDEVGKDLTGVKSERVMCNVDAMIYHNNQIKVIIEIEEADNKPTQVLGKYLTTAISTHYIAGENAPEPLKDVLFIQIIDTSGLSANSHKPNKFDIIDAKIKDIANAINDSTGTVSEYQLHSINGKDDKDGITAVSEAIKTFLNKQ
jgi:hypothetical protein